MVLRVGRGRSDTVEIFQGSEPLRERILSSHAFARNLRALADYYRALDDR